jgi:hypothetical protein
MVVEIGEPRSGDKEFVNRVPLITTIAVALSGLD